MDNQSRTCVFATCFLGAPDPVYDAFSTLGHYLRQHGVELVVFSCWGDFSTYDGFTFYRMPFTLRENGQHFQHAVSASGPALSGAMLQELMTLDREWVGDGTPFEAEVYIQKAFTYWQKAVEILRPCALIAWGTTAPFSRLMMRLGQLNQVPLYVMERGWLQDTLALTIAGQGPFANVSMDISRLYDDVPVLGQDEHWARIHTYYTETQQQHYPTRNQALTRETLKRLRQSRELKILYLGSNDRGGGHSLKGVNQSERVSPWVSTSYDAAAELAAAMETLDTKCRLWIKPHPSMELELPEGTLEGRIDYFRDENIQQLVEMADVVVTLGSTAQIYGLLYDKPFLVMGNSILMGRRIAYEAMSREQLLPALQQAIAGENLTERLTAGKALVTRMYLSDIIGLNDAVPTRLKLTDLASFLIRFKTMAIDTSLKMIERRDRFDVFTAIATGGASHDDPEFLKQQMADQARQLEAQTLSIESLKAQISRLTSEAALSAQTVTRLSNESQKNTDSLHKTRSDLDQLRQQYDILVRASGALESEKRTLEQHNSKQVAELTALRAQAETTAKAHKALVAETQQAHLAERKTLQARIETLDSSLRAETARHADSLKAERQKADATTKHQTAELKTEHKVQIDTLNRLIAQLKTDATALETRHAQVLKTQQQRADAAAQAQETALQSLKTAFENERAALKQQIESKASDLKTAEAAAAQRLKTAQSDALRQHTDTQALINDLKASHAAERTNLQKQMTSLERSHEKAIQRQSEHYEAQIADFRKSLEALSAAHAVDRHQLKVQLSDLDTRLTRTSEDRDHLSEELKTATQLIERYRSGGTADYLQWAFDKTKRA